MPNQLLEAQESDLKSKRSAGSDIRFTGQLVVDPFMKPVLKLIQILRAEGCVDSVPDLAVDLQIAQYSCRPPVIRDAMAEYCGLSSVQLNESVFIHGNFVFLGIGRLSRCPPDGVIVRAPIIQFTVQLRTTIGGRPLPEAGCSVYAYEF
jgi:hypothetical protein